MALLCFPRTNNGKAVKVFLFFTFLCVCVCVHVFANNNNNKKTQSFVSSRNIFFSEGDLNRTIVLVLLKLGTSVLSWNFLPSKHFWAVRSSYFPDVWMQTQGELIWMSDTAVQNNHIYPSTVAVFLPLHHITQWVSLYSSYLVKWPQTSLSERKACPCLFNALYSLWCDFSSCVQQEAYQCQQFVSDWDGNIKTSDLKSFRHESNFIKL